MQLAQKQQQRAAQLRPARSAPAAARSVQRPRAVRVSAAAATGVVGQPSEPAALEAFKAAHGDTKEACLSVLEKAATTKSVAPEIVEGALVWLENASKHVGTVPSIDGTWRLVFSTSTSQRFFQYIPVTEDLVVDSAKGAISLESVVGPFRFVIAGSILGWRPAGGELDFQFGRVDILLGGNKIWTVNPTTKPKTYTFYHVGDKVSAARSSAGGLSLMLK